MNEDSQSNQFGRFEPNPLQASSSFGPPKRAPRRRGSNMSMSFNTYGQNSARTSENVNEMSISNTTASQRRLGRAFKTVGPKRGGIMKRRGVGDETRISIPVDREGDLIMNEDFSRAAKSASPYARPGSMAKGIAVAQPYKIEIRGYTRIVESEMMDFLRVNCSRQFTANNVFLADGVFSFTVPDFQQAKMIKQLSGIRYNKEKLIITFKPESKELLMKTYMEPKEQEEYLMNYLRSRRFTEATKALDLSSLGLDEELKSVGIRPDFNNRIFVSMLLRAMKDATPDTFILNLSSNRINSLVSLREFSSLFPDIQSINFERNFIPTVNDLDNIRGLDKLRELILLNNPLRNRLKSDMDVDKYTRELLKIFPALRVLDQKEVQPVIQFDLPSEIIVVNLPERKQNFYDSEATKNLVEVFLKKFFEMYDRNRPSLVDIYAPNAVFSMSVNTALMTGARNPSSKDNIQDYVIHSRNLLRVKDPKKRQGLLRVNNSTIVSFLNGLPRTCHYPEYFRIDSWHQPEPAILFISAHGYFVQMPDRNIRAFDRTFILIPAPPGSAALLGGWPVIIANDHLHLRYPSEPTEPSATLSIQNLPKERQIIEFSQQTGMNLFFSEQCLRQNNWHYQTAMHNYNDLKLQNIIPPEAYIF